jgi:ribosomal protein S18 acetylase RimI-like enzyme
MTHSATPATELESTLAVRLATDADTARLNRLVNAALSIETFLDGTRTSEESLAAMMRKGAILIAEDGEGRLTGCVYTEVRGERGYLGMLTVDPARQGLGLGTRIMRAAEEHLRSQGCVGVDIVVLSLRTELPPIYRRYGFVETGTAPYDLNRTIKTGDDCHFIVMSKDL